MGGKKTHQEQKSVYSMLPFGKGEYIHLYDYIHIKHHESPTKLETNFLTQGKRIREPRDRVEKKLTFHSTSLCTV